MGFLIDTGIWIDVEQGMLAPADVAAIAGNAPALVHPPTLHAAAVLKWPSRISS